MKIPTLSTIALAVASAIIAATPAKADTILMDFGFTSTTGQPLTWNNINSTIPGFIQGAGNATNSGATFSLNNSAGAASGITLTVVRSFSQSNGNGPSSTTTGYPGTATSDSLYGNTESFNSGGILTSNVFPSLNFSGLSPSITYSFSFYASRGSVADNREARYTLQGAATSFADLNASGNVNNIATINSFLSDAGGNILFTMTPGPNNNNANHFTYLGVMQIDYTAVPEPTAAALALMGAVGVFGYRRCRK